MYVADQTISPTEVKGQPAWNVKAFIKTKFQRATKVNPMDSPYTQPLILNSLLVEWEPYPTDADNFEYTWEPWQNLMDDLGEEVYTDLYNKMLQRNRLKPR